jgi:hypothetical protein
MRVRYSRNTSSEYYPSCNNDKYEKDEFQDGEEIHSVNAQLRNECMNESYGDDNPNGNASFCP